MHVSRPGAWQPGQSGNPRGKVRHSVREELRRLASKKRPDGTTNAKAVAAKAWELGAAGSLKAIQYLTDEIDGPLAKALELTGANGGPMVFTIRIGEAKDEDDGAPE